MSGNETSPEGWYTDPDTPGQLRWWDSAEWTEHVRPMATPPITEPQRPAAPGPPSVSTPPPPTALEQNPFAKLPAEHIESNSRTGLKVLIGVIGVLVLTVGGCVALIANGFGGDSDIEESAPTTTDPTALGEDTEPDELLNPTTSEAVTTTEAPTTTEALSTLGSREDPFKLDAQAAIKWDTFGDADGSIWNTTIGPIKDVTQLVLDENQFNDPPEDGMVFAGFNAEMLLAQAGKEPLSTGFNLQIELIGGASARAHDERCGVVPGEFGIFDEVFVGGTVTGLVCIAIPTEDLSDPGTQVALKFGDTRVYFDANGTPGEPVDVVPSQPSAADNTEGGSWNPLPYDVAVEQAWEVFGDADGSVWETIIGQPRDITDEVLAENQFNDPPDQGMAFAGFFVDLTLLEADKEPLSSFFNISYEIIGGSSLAAHTGSCGVTPDAFDVFAESFIGGTLSGIVCIPVPIEDLNHPDTRVALKFDSDTRSYFG